MNGRPRPLRCLRHLVVALLLAASGASASESGLSGAEGHPRSRFPLALYAPPLAASELDAAVWRAVGDWNTVFRRTFGLEAFARVPRHEEAQITLAIEPRTSPKLMGETHIRSEGGIIVPPVRVIVFEPAARGQTVPETVLYQVVAHELGHALGLAHSADPRSIMCCIRGRVDLGDAAVREAYIEARRHPDLASVAPELAAHYGRFWRIKD